MRQLRVLISCLVFFTLFVGISWAGGKQEAQPEERGGVVSVWKLGGSPKEVEFWPEFNDKFEKENPDIKLDYNYFYGQIRRAKIIGGFKSKNIADVIIAFGQDIPDFAGLNIIQPLDDILLLSQRSQHNYINITGKVKTPKPAAQL